MERQTRQKLAHGTRVAPAQRADVKKLMVRELDVALELPWAWC